MGTVSSTLPLITNHNCQTLRSLHKESLKACKILTLMAETSPSEDVQKAPGSEIAKKDINGPFILSCSKCRTIVGDSFSIQRANSDLRTVTLCAASNIQRSTDLFTSKEGPDVGSTYFRFSCARCHDRLGLYYLTTSKDLDELREKFTFSYESVSLYELGNAQHGGDRPVPLDISDQPHPVTEESESGTEDVRASDGQNVRLSVREEIARIKHVITNLHERMTVSEKLQHDTVDFIKNMRTESPRVSPMQYPQQMTVTQTMTSITPLVPPNNGSHMGFLPNDSSRKRTRM